MTDSLKQEAERRMVATGVTLTGMIKLDDAVAVAVEMVMQAEIVQYNAGVAAERERCAKWLRAIRDYEPTEVMYDEFAYKRLVESYRKAAQSGLEPDAIRNESKPPRCPYHDTFEDCNCKPPQDFADMVGPVLAMQGRKAEDVPPPDANPGKTHFYGDGCDEEHGKPQEEK